MRSIPLTFPPEEDELLGSWIYRLSKANLFDAPDQFVRTFVQPNKAHKYRYIKYKDDVEFSFFYQSLQSHAPMAELFLKTTCYPGYAPFITSGQQTRRINFIFRKSYGDSEFTPKHTPLTPELRRCEQCQQEEINQKGFWYYHRAHQLPGVRVCHKHGCLLHVYNGKWGHEFDEDTPFKLSVANASSDIMQQYAVFAKNILDAAPDTDMVGTKHALREALQQQGHVSRGQIHECIHSDIEQCGMSQICPSDVDHYIKVKLASLSYPSVEETMGMSFFLYRTAEAFLSALPKELPIPLYIQPRN